MAAHVRSAGQTQQHAGRNWLAHALEQAPWALQQVTATACMAQAPCIPDAVPALMTHAPPHSPQAGPERATTSGAGWQTASGSRQ